MSLSKWKAVDDYITDLLIPSDPILDAVLRSSEMANLPPYNVSPNQGQLLHLDKPNNPSYLKWALRLSRRGTLIIGDNVVRDGKITDSSSADPNVQGIRQFFELIAAEPRLSATAIQTVGSKGYDGFALAIVN